MAVPSFIYGMNVIACNGSELRRSRTEESSKNATYYTKGFEREIEQSTFRETCKDNSEIKDYIRVKG